MCRVTADIADELYDWMEAQEQVRAVAQHARVEKLRFLTYLLEMALCELDARAPLAVQSITTRSPATLH